MATMMKSSVQMRAVRVETLERFDQVPPNLTNLVLVVQAAPARASRSTVVVRAQAESTDRRAVLGLFGQWGRRVSEADRSTASISRVGIPGDVQLISGYMLTLLSFVIATAAAGAAALFAAPQGAQAVGLPWQESTGGMGKGKG